jgi:signal transduction histidine kinase
VLGVDDDRAVQLTVQPAVQVHTAKPVAPSSACLRALRRSRAQLRALAAKVESVREQERARIARDVHDRLGQMLTVLNMDLAWLEARVATHDPSVARRLETMKALTVDMLDFARELAVELRPGLLDVGLVAAIEWQANVFEARTGIRCQLAGGADERTPGPDICTALFRILQEALTNVVRHAAASEVVITLERHAHHLVMRVSDNGRGITAQQITRRRSLGILGMRERAALLGGAFAITPSPGGGTTVAVSVPLDPRAG